MFDDSFRNLLGFQETILYIECNLSPNPVDILSFDRFLLGCDFAKGLIDKQKRSGIFHNWTMTVNLVYKNVKAFAGGITWYMMETRDVISSFSFKLKYESDELVIFEGQNISFRLSTNEK